MVAVTCLAACGGGSGAQSSASTTTDPRVSFVAEVDNAGSRHGLSDDQLEGFATALCAGARSDSDANRPSDAATDAGAAINVLLSELKDTFSIAASTTPSEGAAKLNEVRHIVLTAGRDVCPQYNQQVSAAADYNLNCEGFVGCGIRNPFGSP